MTADTLVAPLKAEIDKLQDALFTIKLQLDGVEAERKAFENQMEKEKERADAAESKLALAQEQLAAEQAKFDNCLEFEQRAVKAGEDLNRFKEERDTKLAAMQERVNELKAGAIAASEARNLAEVQLFEARAARDAAKAEVAENKAALEAAQEEARKAAEQLQELEREVKLQRATLVIVQAQKRQAMLKLALSKRVREKLKEKLLECEKRAAGASARTPAQKAQTDAIAQANVDAEVKEAVAEAKQEGDGIDWSGGNDSRDNPFAPDKIKADVAAAAAAEQQLRDDVARLAESYPDKATFAAKAKRYLAALGLAATVGWAAWALAVRNGAAAEEPVPETEDLTTLLQQGAAEFLSRAGTALETALQDKPGAATLTPYGGNSDIDAVVLRGLVGQRGPTEPASVAHCPQDALLPYALPPAKALARAAATARHVLAHSPAPTEDEVVRATRTCRALLAAAAGRADADDDEAGRSKRPRLAPPDAESLVTGAEALAALEGNYAITGAEPARADDARRGVELPHEVRWMPQGPRAATMARVAVLEHAVARCAQVASQADTPPAVARALRGAAAALKLQQLAPLYALKEAAAFEDAPHPLGTAAPLVTRPCAVVRGVLSYPTDAGVAPRPAQVGSGQPGADTARLEQAMGKTAAATAALRNQLRREKAASHFYVAPPAPELAFQTVPTGVTGAGDAANPEVAAAESADEVHEDLDAAFHSVDELSQVTNRALVLVAGLYTGDEPHTDLDAVGAFLDAEALETGGAGAVTAQTRREGLWTEFQRYLAVSQDRLWIFVRLMSGCIGGDVSEVITMADEATLAANRAAQQQRADIGKRVSDMQTKIVETVVGSMLKSSGLTLDYDQNQLTVIDAEARKKLKDLAAGTSGQPFFEANVAMRNLTEADRAPAKLSDVLRSLATAGAQMQATLEKGLVEPGAGAATLAELSHPSNSYFVAMRPDSTAAIREAHEKLNVELVLQGGGRRLALWELVEGGCTVLTNRFADFCGFLLVQKRSSTGVSAMYVSHLSIRTNASQARISLARLVAAAGAYTARVSPPRFLDDAGATEQARWAALTAAEAVQDADVVARPLTLVRSALAAPVQIDGWSVV